MVSGDGGPSNQSLSDLPSAQASGGGWSSLNQEVILEEVRRQVQKNEELELALVEANSAMRSYGNYGSGRTSTTPPRGQEELREQSGGDLSRGGGYSLLCPGDPGLQGAGASLPRAWRANGRTKGAVGSRTSEWRNSRRESSYLATAGWKLRGHMGYGDSKGNEEVATSSTTSTGDEGVNPRPFDTPKRGGQHRPQDHRQLPGRAVSAYRLVENPASIPSYFGWCLELLQHYNHAIAELEQVAPTRSTASSTTTSTDAKLQGMNATTAGTDESESPTRCGGQPGTGSKVPCKFFLSDPGCTRGSTCKFGHSFATKESKRAKCWFCGSTANRQPECPVKAGKSSPSKGRQAD